MAEAAEVRVLSRVKLETSTPAVKRIARLLKLLTRAELLRLAIYAKAEEWLNDWANWGVFYTFESDAAQLLPGHTFKDANVQSLNRAYIKVLAAINESLDRYLWKPKVRDLGYLSLQEVHVWEQLSPDDFWENMAVQWLLAQLKGGSLLRPAPILNFRTCRNCSEWFYALTKHQKFCKQACRKRFDSQSPEFKKKRRDYMRDRYRPDQKSRNARSFALARSLRNSRTARTPAKS